MFLNQQCIWTSLAFQVIITSRLDLNAKLYNLQDFIWNYRVFRILIKLTNLFSNHLKF